MSIQKISVAAPYKSKKIKPEPPTRRSGPFKISLSEHATSTQCRLQASEYRNDPFNHDDGANVAQEFYYPQLHWYPIW